MFLILMGRGAQHQRLTALHRIEMGSFELPLLVTEEYWAMTVAQAGSMLLSSCVGAPVPFYAFPAIALNPSDPEKANLRPNCNNLLPQFVLWYLKVPKQWSYHQIFCRSRKE